MYAPETTLKPLSGITLSGDERKMLNWMRSAKWEPQSDAREPIPYKAKVPEFFSGLRLYNMQATSGAGAAQGPLALFIKKIEFQGIITKQDMYPVSVQGNARYLSLKKIDLENLGIGDDDEDDYDD